MKLKFNEQMMEKFKEGSFAKIFVPDLLEMDLECMNNNDFREFNMTCNYFDRRYMKQDENDVEIIVTLTLKKIEEEKKLSSVENNAAEEKKEKMPEN